MMTGATAATAFLAGGCGGNGGVVDDGEDGVVDEQDISFLFKRCGRPAYYANVFWGWMWFFVFHTHTALPEFVKKK